MPAFALESEVMSLKQRTQTIFDRFEEALPLLTNIRNLYISCTLEGQQLLLKKVFEVGIMWDGERLRTPSINPGLVDNYFRIKEKGLLVVEQPDDFLIKSWSCTVSGNWFEHFSRFVESLLYVSRYKLTGLT